MTHRSRYMEKARRQPRPNTSGSPGTGARMISASRSSRSTSAIRASSSEADACTVPSLPTATHCPAHASRFSVRIMLVSLPASMFCPTRQGEDDVSTVRTDCSRGGTAWASGEPPRTTCTGSRARIDLTLTRVVAVSCRPAQGAVAARVALLAPRAERRDRARPSHGA